LEAFVLQAREAGWDILGHGHPLAFEERFRPLWRRLGVRRTACFEKVLREADVYVADCSSSSFEFAATDRPIVFLDAPCYRGCTFAPRFTHDRAGVTCRRPEDLLTTIEYAYADPDHVAEARAEVVAELFGPGDGLSSQRAAMALMEFYSGRA
jgi:CDP-glycerol glycerophosphotransferase (TagB/SpsB family)